MKPCFALLAFSTFAFAQPSVGGCPVFPLGNIWNVPVDTLALHPNSANIVTDIGGGSPLRLDDVMPINVVPAGTAKVSMSTTNEDSDLGPWPMPASPALEPGADSHLAVIDQGTCILYEAFLATKAADGSWSAYSIAKWDLRSNALRTDGLTSADGAGLPITAGVLRYDEVLSGEVKHALRVTAQVTLGSTYTWPARHYASHSTDANAPKMGQRLRLKASVSGAGFSPRMQVILNALKKYGMIVADNGMSWGMQHDQDARWDSDELLTLHNLLGSSMEVVDVSPLLTDVDSGIALVAPPLGLYMSDVLGRRNSVPLGSGLSVVNGTIQSTSGGGGSAVTSVAGRTGDVTLGMGDVADLNTTVTSLNGSVSTLTTGLNSTNTQLAATNVGLANTNTSLATTNANLGTTNTALANTNTNLTNTNNTVSNLSANVASLTTQLAATNTALAGKQDTLTFNLPLSKTGNAISCVNCGPGIQNHSGAATYINTDNKQPSGTWKGSYGNDGYVIVGDTTKLPVYASLSALGNQTTTWANSTNDSRALQKAGNGRVAAAWSSSNTMTIDVNIGDGQAHKVALYFLDWDHLGRKQQVVITDLQGNPLDPADPVNNPRLISGFDNGRYLQWSVTGHVVIHVLKDPTTPAAATAVVSAVFVE